MTSIDRCPPLRAGRTSRRWSGVCVVGVLTLVLGLAGCAQSPANAPTSDPGTVEPVAPRTDPSPSPPAFTGHWRVAEGVVTVASGLTAPWAVAALPDGALAVSERDSGVIRVVSPDGRVGELGRIEGVVSGGESGLHGLAVLVDGERHWLYAYHGAADDNRVVRAPLTFTADGWRLGSVETVFAGIPRANTHNGGRIAFGPDGLLYVTTGDAQNVRAAQDPAQLGGKILRLTADGDPAGGNPFGTAVYSLGHRNVQGITWSGDGAMWASEFGQNTWDELNRIEAGGNYGWPEVEGRAGDERFIDPVAVWATAEASPSGIAAVGETVFMTGLRGERLWAIDVSGAGAEGEPIVVLDGYGRLRDAVATGDGSLWVLTNNTDGRGDPREGDDVLLRVPLGPAG
ncbi:MULTISPECIES: PQQ-dependent sugar dehydrogenase [unclassified Microbacterium]|uniref:PQQ-dependent sugar dehydrogenase n=1 Tax=unclassified Microbacterium TaxID=2609290 RepID=UPI000F5502AD|nr:PQQ-dependent sugar dehydrogenase [Microbacterium sp. ABRD28]AZC14072.1 PQQ-dependent sugar dehydrogenase [Microbacterium sp. ABRD28]